ncbi:MAG: C45 family autoproteolytic acyltransferase/hydrolase [Fimbriimonadaceae bacterium]
MSAAPLAGSPYEVGRAQGERLGATLEKSALAWVDALSGKGLLSKRMRNEGALEWLETLPERWREEIIGLADGAGGDLGLIAANQYCEKYRTAGCSSFFLREGDGWIVARNTDASDYGPVWNYLPDRQINGLNRWTLFTVQGDIYGATGLTHSGLWLHYNYAQVVGPTEGDNLWTWLADTLESGDNLAHVEDRLNHFPRNRAMVLFALDAKTQEAVIYECEAVEWSKRMVEAPFAIGTNHFIDRQSRATKSSLGRYGRLESLLAAADNVEDAKRAILDPDVAQSGKTFGTVFSAVWSSGNGRLLHATGGLPPKSDQFRQVQRLP